MRIKSVEIKNIASIEKAMVSFEEQPLKGADLFLISGPTGSGKTTLLDAITLALYATTPRIKKGSGNAQNVNSDQLTGSDPRNMMRMNTGNAFSKVCFTGNDGKEYCAEWSVERRTVNRRSGETEEVMQNFIWCIRNLTDNVEVSGDKQQGYKDVAAVIVKAVGLDFDQFCRTTMLAQGEFTQFLKSDEKGKADILEKISGSDIYSRIGDKIYTLWKEADARYEKEQQKHDSIAVFPPDVRVAKENEAVAMNAELVEIGKEMEKVQNRINWMKEWQKAVAEESEAKEKAGQSRAGVESEDFIAKEKLHKEWNTTIDVRGKVLSYEGALARKMRAKEDLVALAGDFRRAVAGYEHEKLQLEVKRGEKVGVEKELDGQGKNVSAYANAQTIVAKVQGIESYRSQLELKEKALGRCVEVKLPELVEKVAQLQGELKSAKGKEEEARSRMEEMDGKVKAMGIAGLRKEREFLLELKKDVETVARLKNEVTMSKKGLSVAQAKIAPAEEVLAKEKDERTRLEKEHERRRQSVDETVKDIRQKLAEALGQEDNVCPVCGHLVKTLQDDSIFDKVAEQAKREFEEQKLKYDEAESALNKLSAEVVVLCANVDKTAALLEKAQKDLAVKVSGREDKEQLLGMSHEQLQGEVDALAGKIEKGEELEKEFKELSGIYNGCTGAVSAINVKFVTAEAEEKRVRADIERLNKEKEDLARAIADVQMMVEELLDGSEGWSADWKGDAAGFIRDIEAKAKRYDDMRKLAAELESSIGRMEPVVGQVADAMERIQGSMPEWRIEGIAPIAVQNLDRIWPDLERKVNSLLNVVSISGEEAEKNRKAVESFLKENAGFSWERLKLLNGITLEEVGRMSEEISSRKQAFKVAVQRYEDSKVALEKIVGERLEGEQIEIEALDELKNGFKGRNDDLVSALALLNQELAKDDENIRLKGDTSALETLKSDAEKWSAFNSLYGDKDGKKLKKIAQSFILESLLNAANSHLKSMAPRYRLLVVPGKLELKLEDRYNGFSTRSTNTISGGESFLVSLSLALALADFGQHLGVSTLFIDEGFGTLSGKPLQNAINTLRMLHSEAGRQVGIISHREELRESIPVQIKVNLPDGSSVAKVEI